MRHAGKPHHAALANAAGSAGSLAFSTALLRAWAHAPDAVECGLSSLALAAGTADLILSAQPGSQEHLAMIWAKKSMRNHLIPA